jgi:hypothetical protein
VHHLALGALAFVAGLLIVSYFRSPPSLNDLRHIVGPRAQIRKVISSKRAGTAGSGASNDAVDRGQLLKDKLRRAQEVAHRNHEEHHQADVHIMEHWKERAAQLAPRHEQEGGAEVEKHNATTISVGSNHKQQLKRDDLDAKKFLAFHGIDAGQGAGNVISGLLAAHLYGLEFGRIVCLTTGMAGFFAAYEPVDPDAVTYCPMLRERGLPETRFAENSFNVLTYGTTPNECQLKKLLESAEPVIYMGGNTYPRWPVVPKEFFTRFYRPRPALQRYLPPPPQPHIVVHLRLEDGTVDKRRGLDPQSLDALGRLLSNATTSNETIPYLVTNHVEWFDYFSSKFGWRHPEWLVVTHSALGDAFGGAWGRRAGADVDTVRRDMTAQVQNLQMWSDWNTLLMARMVYHTHSDFSVSAVHWMDTDSKSIQGYNAATGQLVLVDESWRTSWKEEGVTPPLKDRTEDGEGIARLRCGGLMLNFLFGKGKPPDLLA